jgi:hypothetical protein
MQEAGADDKVFSPRDLGSGSGADCHMGLLIK